MAFIALAVGNNVVARFAFGRCTIVAACAGPWTHVDVVEYRGCPGVGAVAVITGIAAGYMVPGFAIRDAAVMATGARAQHGAVVDAINRYPA